MSLSYRIVKFLEETPASVRHLALGLTDAELRRKPTNHEFSVLEHVCHLRDIEREGYVVRIKKLLNEECPFLSDIDGDELAEQRNYNSQDLDAALDEFSRARAESVGAIRDLTLDQLSRSGVLETVGPITIGNLLMLMTKHDEEHLRALNKARNQLGKEK